LFRAEYCRKTADLQRRVSGDPFHRKSVRKALRDWDSSQALAAHPLAFLGLVDRRRAAAGYGPTVMARGVALRDVLQSAMERLRPDRGPENYYDKRWRPFLILQQQYLLGRAPDYLAQQMGIERSTYDHSQVEALEALGGILREWEQLGLTPEAELLPAGRAQAQRGIPFNAPPRASHPLVGRAEVINSLERRLTRENPPRAVALTGIPGVGKTAVAVQLAHDARLQERFPGGILWAGLGSHPNLEGQLTLWAVALGMDLENLARLRSLEPKVEAVHAAIGQRQVLLIIDDVWKPEHGLAMRVGGPGCACLYTTRFPGVASELAGEEVVPIRELSLESGVSMLEALVPALARDHPRTAGRLVDAVGGLPLGLVLIGGYLQREAQTGQHGRLDRALERLTGAGSWMRLEQLTSPLEGQPALEDRWRLSLEKVINLSVASLDPEDRSALRAISYLAPKPNTVSEEAIQGCSDRPVGTVDTLVDRGLLESIGSKRYCIHRTIVDHMRLLPRDEDAEDRLIQYYISWIGTVGSDRPDVGLEAHNILVALQLARARELHHALASGIDAFVPHLETIGWPDLAGDLLAWGESAAQATGEPRLLCRIWNHKGRWNQRRSDFLAADESFRRALALARRAADGDSQCEAMTGLGVIALSRGDFAAADRALNRALRWAEQGRLWRHAGAILANLGSLALARGKIDEAERRMHAGLQLARESKDLRTARALLANLGVLSARRGDLTTAEERFQESLELARASASRRDMGSLLANLGTLASDRGDIERAWDYMQEAYDLAAALDDRVQLSHLMGNMGALALRRNDFEMAHGLIERGLAIAQEIGHKESHVLLLINRGALRGRLGDIQGAEADLAEAAKEAELAGLLRYTCAAWIEKAELALGRGALSQARTGFERARGQARQIHQRALEARAIFGLAKVAACEDMPEAAAELARESLAILEQLGSFRKEEVQRFLQEGGSRAGGQA
jgi:tetratricopeptide (TPR) repeat protein